MNPANARTSLLFSRLALALVALCAVTALGACNLFNSPAPTQLLYVTSSPNDVRGYRIDNKTVASTPIFTAPFLVGRSPFGIVVHPSLKTAYVANQLDNTISRLTIDSASGALTEVLPRTNAALGPGPMLLDSSSNFLYVGNTGSNNVSVFSVGGDGSLSLTSTASLGSTPDSMALAKSSAGTFLYVTVPNFSAVYGFAVSSGTLSPVAGSPLTVSGGVGTPAVDPAGKFLYVPNPSHNTISGFSIGTGGDLSPLPASPYVAGASASDIPVAAITDPTGAFLYVANSGAKTISQFSIDSVGDLTALSGTPPTVGTSPGILALDSTNTFLFVANVGGGTLSILKIKSDGTLSSTGNTIQVGAAPRGLAFSK